MSTKRVLVVGTTSDYIDMIDRRYPQQALFLTDPSVRFSALEPPPAPADEVVADLTQGDPMRLALTEHLARHAQTVAGVACFDCETLSLAAELAREFHAPFASSEAVAACRSKFESKRLWQASEIPCPAARLVLSAQEVEQFCAEYPGKVVLKPNRASGSQLVFVCRTTEEAVEIFTQIRLQLLDPDFRPAGPIPAHSAIGTVPELVIEQHVSGQEFSCDLILEEHGAHLIRIARKVMDTTAPTGTTLGYEIPGQLPSEVKPKALVETMRRAARALGLTRTLAMVDFIIKDEQPWLLEMTPRPGGDCLPQVIHSSSRMDMLGVALDFARGMEVTIPPRSQWRHRVGLRLLARQEGTIARLSDSALRNDPRVLTCHLARRPGHRVILPPRDYDSRILGHAIFVPAHGRSLASECRDLADMLAVFMVHDRPRTAIA